MSKEGMARGLGDSASRFLLEVQRDALHKPWEIQAGDSTQTFRATPGGIQLVGILVHCQKTLRKSPSYQLFRLIHAVRRKKARVWSPADHRIIPDQAQNPTTHITESSLCPAISTRSMTIARSRSHDNPSKPQKRRKGHNPNTSSFMSTCHIYRPMHSSQPEARQQHGREKIGVLSSNPRGARD